jgi:glycosyltransferase involved in cell wall biosynthesis
VISVGIVVVRVMSEQTIAVNATIVGEQPTGLGVYALNLISALDAVGERLTVYTSCPALVDAPHARLREAPVGLRPEWGARGHLRRLWWTQTTLRRQLRREPPRALLNLRSEGLLDHVVPQVTVVHDVLPLRYPHEYPRQQYYFRYYVPRVLAASEAVLAISQSTREDVLAFYRLPEWKVRVVFAGYDEHRFSPARHDSTDGAAPYALYVGNVMPHKNVLRLVEAFATLARRRDVRLMLVGSGRPRHVDTVRAVLERLGIGASVDWRPYATVDELVRLYRGARMLVMPSLLEGFGLPVLEAMGCGVPVVTSNVSSLPEVVGDAALLVDPTDVVSIAGGMERLFADDALARELRQRGLARARLFSWDRTGRAVQAVLREVAPVPGAVRTQAA